MHRGMGLMVGFSIMLVDIRYWLHLFQNRLLRHVRIPMPPVQPIAIGDCQQRICFSASSLGNHSLSSSARMLGRASQEDWCNSPLDLML
jgi:hypothetical protein